MNYIKNSLPFIALLLVCSCFTACKNANKSGDYANTLTFAPGDESKIAEAFLSMKDSTQIVLKQGTYKFDNLSIAQVKHILIKGEGKEKTVLDFSAQSKGGEGIRVTDVKGFSIDGLTIRDSKGDLLKVNKSRDIKITNVNAVWHTADSTSGGYALYPVLCKNVLIENCYVEGSSDAGIYVGQSDSAIVRNCKGAKNVAGCEIENTTNAEVYNNEFYNNTAGFLVFDLPDLSQRGGHTKAHDNYIHDNNFKNFAKAGSFGTAWGVGNAPPGSGVIILATSDVEIYNNRIINNNTSAIILASGFSTDEKAAERINDHYSPLSKNIKIYGNTMQMGTAFPEAAKDHHIGKMVIAVSQKLQAENPKMGVHIPFILYDGFSGNIMNNGTASNPDNLCIQQPGENMFVNADFVHIMQPAQWHPGTDIKPYVCPSTALRAHPSAP